MTPRQHVGGRLLEYSLKGRKALYLVRLLAFLMPQDYCLGDMSLAELKESVLALPEKERHDFFVWLNRLEASHGDISSTPLPDGYFATDYPLPEDRLELEAAMAKVKQSPDR